MKKVVVDTNFLMLPYTEGIDIFSELERLIVRKNVLIVPREVTTELERIIDNRESRGRDKTAARIALQLIEKKNMVFIDEKGSVDDQIIAYSKKNSDTVVCTNDKELRKKLGKLNVEIIGMRGGNHLDYV